MSSFSIPLAFHRSRRTLCALLSQLAHLSYSRLIRWHAARIEYPSLEEAKDAWKGVVSQHGPSPWDDSELIIALECDGTLTPGESCFLLSAARVFPPCGLTDA